MGCHGSQEQMHIAVPIGPVQRLALRFSLIGFSLIGFRDCMSCTLYPMQVILTCMGDARIGIAKFGAAAP